MSPITNFQEQKKKFNELYLKQYLQFFIQSKYLNFIFFLYVVLLCEKVITRLLERM